MTPGLYPDMPAEQYHSIAAMSAGGLKRMRKSPAHFYGAQLDPQRPQGGEPTPAQAERAIRQWGSSVLTRWMAQRQGRAA